MKFSRRFKRVASALLAVTMAFVMTFSTDVMPMADSKQDQLKAEVEAKQAELDKVNAAIKEAKDNKANAEAVKSQLEDQKTLILSQISLISDQITDLQSQIYEKQTQIDEKQIEVDNKQAEYDQRWADFKQRMGAMQMLNDGGSIALLSSATNLYQLLTFAQTLEQISSKDQSICEELENQRADLEAQRTDLENAKAELEATQASLEEQNTQLNNKQDELAVNIAQANEDIDEATAQQEAAEEAAAEARKKLDAAAAALDAYLNAQNQKYGNASITCSLDFGRPLATFKYISCYFGGGGHRGTDYAAPGGTQIYTSADGIVTAATYHYSWGYYVQVYHGTDSNGNTYSTLYAHMNSAPVVSVGQTVTKGQLLGYVGTTGNSTGNHLHLEMKVNGVLTSVTNYIS